MWWSHMKESLGRVKWWSHVVVTHGGVTGWWCHMKESIGGVTHVGVSREGFTWWSHGDGVTHVGVSREGFMWCHVVESSSGVT
jgi:hypothetical protein